MARLGEPSAVFREVNLNSMRMLTAAIDTLTHRCVEGIEADRARRERFGRQSIAS